MPSKEILFQNHLCAFLHTEHHYYDLDDRDVKPTQPYHFIEEDILDFIKSTQAEQYAELVEGYASDADATIIKALINEIAHKPLWLIMRKGLMVKGTMVKLYAQQPRSGTSPGLLEQYKQNKYTFKKEYRYNPHTQERLDVVIWLNGLPIIVMELKHEDEGQNVYDAINESFLNRELNNPMYKLPFLFIALSDKEAKVATNLKSEKSFRWFNANLTNEAETKGEYPVEHVYRHALSPHHIAAYLEHYLVFVPINEDKGITSPFTIFPRYHQLRASDELAKDVQLYCEDQQALGKKYLINHSAGSGKTLTIAWMADQLDSLYTSDNKKVFDNIIILTDRRALDKNVKDDLELFSHLGPKLNFAKKAKNLAEYLDKNKDIIVTTIHKFAHIQEKLQKDDILKKRKVAFLIDEAHRSQDGKMALTMRKFFNDKEADDAEIDEDKVTEELEALNISNQVFVAFTATTTPKTVAYFGEPFDIYSEEEAIAEGYILDVANNIISYSTLYNLKLKEALPDKEFPNGIVQKLLQNIAFEDDAIIQYKSEVIIKQFEENVIGSIKGQGKAMVVASSRVAGLKYFNTIKAILKDKDSPWKVLYAFSDFTDSTTQEKIEESKVNHLGSKLIEDVFDTPEYRILVVANKFQTGFDQPLLSTMFLDKSINNVNAIQTVSRLNRNHDDKTQEDILVVDFTNNAKNIFDAFNKHRKGSPYKQADPKKEVLIDLYDEIIGYKAFTPEQIETYISIYIEAANKALDGDASSDADLSNLTIAYRNIFNEKLKDLEERKTYVSRLRRYTKLYYFIAQFFELDVHLHQFIVFAEVMGQQLIPMGKGSEMKEFLKKVELSKAGVKSLGIKTNLTIAKEPKAPTGLRTSTGGGEMPMTCIQLALEDIKEKYVITTEDAIEITEICKVVTETTQYKEKIIANKEKTDYLETSAKPSVEGEVTNEYINRNLWDKLDKSMYTEKGGIISLIGRSVIDNIIGAVG